MSSRREYSPTSSQSSLSRSPSPLGRSHDGFAPPLPPRAGTIHLTPYSRPPPPYSESAQEHRSRPPTRSWASQDPRSSSTQSLVPADSNRDGRRTLLLVYIHGFMGNESSFRSFPAHVHNLVTVTLAETHVVHTKIYPRYKSRRAIEYAGDDFSNWLCPHESPDTDVILLGHSMGGILSAEVALLTPYSPASRDEFWHRILGTISFDTPFLGMHPGVVVSGIGSLFRAAPDPSDMELMQANGGDTSFQPPGSPPMYTGDNTPLADSQGGCFDQSSTFPALSSTTSESASADSAVSPFSSPANDPNYNPPFPNDVRIPIRTGWDNALHFITKHSDGLTKATRSYVTSHLEFGGCLADYKGLRNRYAKIRALEDVDELSQDPYNGQKVKRRVRFANYYTASTGRGKPAVQAGKHHPDQRGRSPRPVEVEMRDMSLSTRPVLSTSTTRSPSRSPRISVEEHRDGQVLPQPLRDTEDFTTESQPNLLSYSGASSETSEEMNTIDPVPIDSRESSHNDDKEDIQPTHSLPDETQPLEAPTSTPPPPPLSSLPPIPLLPTPPPPFDPTPYTSKDTLKLATKEHARLLKTHARALKDRDTAIKDRCKLLEKREKKARQDREKQVRADEKVRRKYEKERLDSSLSSSTNNKRLSTAAADDNENAAKKAAKLSKPPPKQHDRKFCVLPPKNPATTADGSGAGKRDPCWVRVYMQGVDEVGAHCGLFFVGPHYESLVGDVGARIEEWVREGESVRLVRELALEAEGRG